MARLCGEHHFFYNGLGFLGVLFQVVAESLADGCGNGGSNLIVAELGLCLTLELGLKHFYRYYGSEAVAEVIAGNLYLGILEQVVVLGIFLEGGGKAAAEAGEVCTALDGVDVVDE